MTAIAQATTQRVLSTEAEVLLLAIAMQESGLRHRVQVQGPARGYWQFEKLGGLAGVMQHVRTSQMARASVEALDLDFDIHQLWDALPLSELLQTVLARLLLWSDSRPLPKIGDKDGAWEYYLRNWRPGKPHRGRWDASYDGAVELCSTEQDTILHEISFAELRDLMSRAIDLLEAA
jgi:hypothetical protein